MDETVKTNEVAEQETKTFTQEDVNAIVQKRLFEERKKYEGIDLEALKEKANKFDEMEEANKTELQKATEKAQNLQNELNAIKKSNEIRDIRERVSIETGVPTNLLTADNEEDCKKQAEDIKAFATPSGYPKVRDGGEVQNFSKISARDEFKTWAEQVNN